jgi:hypothetical protein
VKLAIQIKQKGAWREVGRLLKDGPKFMRKSVEKELREFAKELRDKIVEGVEAQAPGGKAFKPLKKTTLAARRFRGFDSQKALIGSEKKNLLESITVRKKGDKIVVGVFGTRKGHGGIGVEGAGEINEYGKTILIPYTAKMRRFLHAMFKQEGLSKPGNGNKDIIKVKVPARPFVDPVIKKYASSAAISKRIGDKVRNNLKSAFRL